MYTGILSNSGYYLHPEFHNPEFILMIIEVLLQHGVSYNTKKKKSKILIFFCSHCTSLCGTVDTCGKGLKLKTSM